MRRDATLLLRCGRPPFRAGAAAAFVPLIALSLSACAPRSGPPAPLVDRTGIYYTRPAAPVAPEAPAATSSPRAAVASAPLAAPKIDAAPKAAPVTRATLPAPPAAKSSPAPGPAEAAPARESTGTVVASAGGTVTVRKGDTLYAVSRREQVPIRALIDANDLKPPYGLRPGQRLTVPSVRVYVVAPGDTVTAISRRFDTGVSEVIQLNGLKAPDFGLYAGQRLALPRATPAPSRPTGASPAVQRAAVTPPAPRVEVRDPSAPPPPRAARKFGWPLQGRLLSGFGAKGGGLYNDGINIAARPGTIVRASENGIVAYVGNELRGYGNLILLRHADGWISAYAHAGEFLVRRGQVVKRGQPIAKVGASGAVAEPQLHFELRRGNRAVDPKRYLG